MNYSAPQTSLSWNWHTYQRLKLSLSLGLRRQIFVAVCDDLALRDQLAAQLHAELAYSTRSSEAAIVAPDPVPTVRNYTHMVSLNLNLSDPNPMTQIAQWLTQHPPPVVEGRTMSPPGFQILGIERLTRQPAAVQRLFLSYLQGIEHSLTHLESSLVLWLTRPWFYSIQQSASEFWSWHTGTFEFAGEPTPTEESHVPEENGYVEQDHPPDLVIASTESVISIAARNQRIRDMLTEDLAQMAAESHNSIRAQATELSDQPESHPVRSSTPITAPKPAATPAEDPDDEEDADSGNVGDVEPDTETTIVSSPSPPTPPSDNTDGATDGKAATSPVSSSHLPDNSSAQTQHSSNGNSNGNGHNGYGNNGYSNNGYGNNGSTTILQPSTRRDLPSQDMVPVVAKASFKSAGQSTNGSNGNGMHGFSNGSSLVMPTKSVTALEEKPQVDAEATRSRALSPVLTQALDAQDTSLELPATPAVAPSAATAIASQEEQLQRLLDTTANTQPFQTLRYIEQLHKRQAPPADLAAAYRTLGNVYRDRIEQGDQSPQTLKMAIRVYEQALKWLKAEDDTASMTNGNGSLQGNTTIWAEVLNDLGNLYWMLSRSTIDTDQKLVQMEQSIRIYHAAISKADANIVPQLYAMIQNNLGTAYGDLARYRDPAENLQQSVLAYQETLRYRSAEADPQKRAATQNNLGTAYWHLAQHQQPAIYLRQAIAAYSEALQAYSPDDDGMTYAMVQNNLGTAYWNLSQYEQPMELLRLAIAAYEVALRHRTAEVMPVAHAATQNNLGTAYWHLANHLKDQPTIYQQCLQQAIAAYLIALNTAAKVASSPLSFDLSATHNNLGLAYYQVAIDKHSTLRAEARINHLEASLHHHLQAYEGWQQHPDFAQAALTYLVQTLRAFHSEFGLQGQNQGLSKLPGYLLPMVLSRL